jgi:hypothetical protein
MKTEAAATKSAVPSILIVVPRGMTKWEIRGSILTFSSQHWRVIGRAADLQTKDKRGILRPFKSRIIYNLK